MIAKGSTVWTVAELYSYTTKRRIPPNTEGRVLAVKLAERRVLVKLAGFAWPKDLSFDEVLEKEA